jgi:hypothetical protein
MQPAVSCGSAEQTALVIYCTALHNRQQAGVRQLQQHESAVLGVIQVSVYSSKVPVGDEALQEIGGLRLK